MTEQCEDCVFFKDEFIGLCRFNPPQALYAYDSGRVVSEWPSVLQTDWCGKFHRSTAQ